MEKEKSRGFASMDPERQRAIARAGGKAAHESGNAHRFTREEASKAGKVGGRVISADKAHMSAIGTKGGLARRKRKERLYANPIDKHSDRSNHC